MNSKVIEYTSRWKDFQFRSPVNIFEPNKVDPYKFDLVKWRQHEPYEVTNGFTGEKEISTESCFTIGTLIWDAKEELFDFESCGLRYLEYRIDGLEDWILAFANLKEIELRSENDSN